MDKFSKYVVVRPCPIAGGTMAEGSIIDLINGCIYVNNCMMAPVYQTEIMRVINTEESRGFHYLRPKPVMYNKI